MPPSDQYMGLTPPISLALPTEDENKLNAALLEELRAQNTFESPPDTEKRHKVLASIQKIADEFVRRVASRRHPNKDSLIKHARGKVFTYGSFRLGVYGPGSDIDTLVVAPKYVTREDYFEIFPGLLTDMAPPGAITDLTSVQDAFVPIIKFEYSGISIDLIFSRIAVLQELPADASFDLKDSKLLRGLDEKELRSLNGTRVTDEILSLVPEKATFRLALRAIKLWAQRRAVYANIMGFPGGVAWAMLVARVCQLYPKATSSTIVCRFFQILSKWPWPQPVLLKRVEDGPLQVRVWNPEVYKADTFHLMPVITPAYPSMCATYNISRSTKAVIEQQLKHATEVSSDISSGKLPWSALFERHTFFTKGYKYYLAIVTTATDKESYKMWTGLVESKVRVLVQSLDRHDSVQIAHPYVKGFERVHKCKSPEEIVKVQEGSLEFVVPKADPPAEGEAEGTEKPVEVEEGVTLVYTQTHYIGLELHLESKSLDLTTSVKEFRDICTKNEMFDANVNFLNVHNVRNFSLPDDVFEPGEEKPKRKLVKKVRKVNNGSSAATNTQIAGNKRVASETVSSEAKRRQSAEPTSNKSSAVAAS